MVRGNISEMFITIKVGVIVIKIEGTPSAMLKYTSRILVDFRLIGQNLKTHLKLETSF